MLLDSSGVPFRVLETQGGARSENSEKLEFEDLLNENAMFLRSQGLQHETEMIPQRAKRRKESREEAKKEKRGENSALQSVRGALWGEIWGIRARGGCVQGRGGGPALLRCEEYYEILKICETVAKIKHVGKRGSVENRRFSRNRLKPINSARGRIVSKLKL